MAQRPELSYFDPRENQAQTDPAVYTAIDLAAIRAAEVVLAYAEADNPGLVNLALEVGYAHALGRRVVLVLDPALPRRYWGIPLTVSESNTGTLEVGVAAL